MLKLINHFKNKWKNFNEKKNSYFEKRRLENLKLQHEDLLQTVTKLKAKISKDELDLEIFIQERSHEIIYNKKRLEKMERELKELGDLYLENQIHHYKIDHLIKKDKLIGSEEDTNLDYIKKKYKLSHLKYDEDFRLGRGE